MAEPEQTERIYELAQQLYETRQLSERQFMVWHLRAGGMTVYAIREELMATCHASTLYRDLLRAREIIGAALLEANEGEVRLGHTLAQGSESRWAQDTVLTRAARSCRAMTKAKERAG